MKRNRLFILAFAIVLLPSLLGLRLLSAKETATDERDRARNAAAVLSEIMQMSETGIPKKDYGLAKLWVLSSEFKEVKIMNKFFILSLVCILSGLMLAACQREQGVQAGNEQGRTGEYQPRSAPSGEAEQSQAQQGQAQQGQEMTGELQRVDMAGKTITVRVDNGMEQTFKFDDNTMVMGLEGQPQASAPSKSGKAANASIQNLVGKEGSEVTVQWRDENGAKMATHINVTQVNTSKKGKTKGTY